MGEQVGEFDLEVMSDIFTLVKRLTPICKASEMGSETKREKQNDGKKSSEIQKNTEAVLAQNPGYAGGE